MPEDREQNSQAGLSYAPPYDRTREFDPNKAEVISTPETVRPEDFAFFRSRMEKQATMGRIVLIVVLLLAVGANLILTLKAQDVVVDNISQARHDQAVLDERLLAKFGALETRIATLEQMLDEMKAAHPVAEVAAD